MPDLSKDTLLFARERRRMCKTVCCEGCKLDGKICQLGSRRATEDEDREVLKVVQEWSDAHPARTYAQDFFEKFPDAPRRDDGSPKACRCVVYSNNHCKHNGCEVCWNEPMEEENDETD